jgi:hypothetical protein
MILKLDWSEISASPLLYGDYETVRAPETSWIWSKKKNGIYFFVIYLTLVH